MADPIKAARGMRDSSGEDLAHLHQVESSFENVLTAYAYEPIRLPLLEQSALFSRGLGEATDAVSKEMFVFERESKTLALRPEGTASCVRAAIAEGLGSGTTRRLWYSGSMFRYERPQKGRYREFYQVGAEAFGFQGPDVDGELIQIVDDVFNDLGITDLVELEINTLGSSVSRRAFRDSLVQYLQPFESEFSDEESRTYQVNPLRLLDSKNPRIHELLEDAPLLWDYLDEDSRVHFEQLCSDLEQRGISYKVNRVLVRGLDYYTHSVFEWNTEQLGAQKQLGGGGRYDGLSQLLGGPECPAAGFAMGIDRIALLLAEQQSTVIDQPFKPDVYVLALYDEQQSVALQTAMTLRRGSDLKIRSHFGGGKVKARMRSADRSGADFALIIGEDEALNGEATVKWLREDRPQVKVPTSDLSDFLNNQIKSNK